jgi:hypothetical protein
MSASKKPADGAEPTPEDETTPEEETKRKFREALAAKQGRKGEDNVDTGPQQVHSHGPIETKRTFRRKTG